MDKLITGKIFVSKKSGPGEITGIIDVELDDRDNVGVTGATFTDLQFTDPGDYVLNIYHSAGDLDPVELKITVLPEDEIISQQKSKDGNTKDETQVEGNRPIIAQIDEPTIVLPPIKMKCDSSGPNSQDEFVQGMGYTPVIWYNAFAIEERSLKKMRLYHDGILPKIEFTFEDTNDILQSEATPTDDGSIDLFLNSTSANLKSLHMSFKMESFIQVNDDKYTIIGRINVPDLYVPSNKSYNETSFTTLRNISKEMGLGFNSNIVDTDDKMHWRCTYKKPYEFISDIISHSYISDESYMVGYIDYYYCFNYVDIEKEYSRDVSNDVGIDTSGLSEQSAKSEDRIIKLILTTDSSLRSTCNFIEKMTKINDSTKKSLKDGYSTITKTYDRINKQFLIFSVDSITTDGSETVILKGARNDNKYKNENIKHEFIGKIDDDNVHKNYNYSFTQNKINLSNLNRIAINAILPNVNWNLYKFQKIDVKIINETETIGNTDIVDFRYSGFYIIADIEYYWNGYNISQKLRLVRKELSKTPEEIKNDPVPATEPKKEETKNYNPVVEDTHPNLEYNIGQSYFLKNDKEVYEISINSLNDNGIELTGTLIPRGENYIIERGIYTFNVTNKNVFSFVESNFNKVNLTIIPYEEVDEKYLTENYQDEFLDEEYSESGFEGTEEELVEFSWAESSKGSTWRAEQSDYYESEPTNYNYSYNIDDNINLEKLRGYIPDNVINQLNSVMSKFNITNILRLAHFLAQCAHESGGFKITVENLNYSKSGLNKIFSNYFPGDLAVNYEKKPEKIGSRVYANRMNNGSESTKEGYKFRGRGYIQLTGKGNYTSFSKFIGEDVVLNPDIVSTKYPLASAAYYFNKKNGWLWKICDKGSSTDVITEVTKKVNGGTNGLNDRISRFNKIYKLLTS